MSVTLRHGDCREVLATLQPESVRCVVTSPPYYGLRDYGVDGQIGLEQSPAEYVAQLVEVFREVRRVLRPDGTLWLNLGDSYAGSRCGPQGKIGEMANRTIASQRERRKLDGNHQPRPGGKAKDLMLIPARVAIALQDHGWWVRSDIIWSKPNPMPESVTDRPTKAHEYVFLLTKSERYFYDAAAIAEPAASADEARWDPGTYGLAGADRKTGKSTRRFAKPAGWDTAQRAHGTIHADGRREEPEYSALPIGAMRNARSVWTIATTPYAEAHFATFPPALAERCIKAGSRPGDTVLDPFAGAGTTLLVADRLQRHAVGIELNPDYCELIRRRLAKDAPLLSEVA